MDGSNQHHKNNNNNNNTASNPSTTATTSASSTSSSSRRRLTKKPPSSHSYYAHRSSNSTDARFDARSIQSKSSSTSLRRAPSAPPARTPSSNNASNSSSPRHPPPSSSAAAAAAAAGLSGNSYHHHHHPHQPQLQQHSRSLNPSPILPSGDFASGLSFSSSSSSHQAHNNPASASSATAARHDPAHSGSRDRYRLSDPHNNHSNHLNYGLGTASTTHHRLNSKASEEFIGAPFDGSAILNRIEATKSPTSPNRPCIPRPAYTSPDTRLAGLSLTQSASFSAANDKMAAEKASASRASDNQLSQSKRFSDETKEPRMASVLRKKSGFSGFMTSLVGSPKKPTISAPENPVHVTHVGYDSATGQFTVRRLPSHLLHWQ